MEQCPTPQCGQSTQNGTPCKNGKNCSRHIICGVCLGYCKKTIILECGHKYCKECILPWFVQGFPNSTCPTCRNVITDRAIINRAINWGIEKRKVFEAIEIQLPFSQLSPEKQEIFRNNFYFEMDKCIPFNFYCEIKEYFHTRNDHVSSIFNELRELKKFKLVYFSTEPPQQYLGNVFHYYLFT